MDTGIARSCLHDPIEGTYKSNEWIADGRQRKLHFAADYEVGRRRRNGRSAGRRQTGGGVPAVELAHGSHGKTNATEAVGHSTDGNVIGAYTVRHKAPRLADTRRPLSSGADTALHTPSIHTAGRGPLPERLAPLLGQAQAFGSRRSNTAQRTVPGS